MTYKVARTNTNLLLWWQMLIISAETCWNNPLFSPLSNWGKSGVFRKPKTVKYDRLQRIIWLINNQPDKTVSRSNIAPIRFDRPPSSSYPFANSDCCWRHKMIQSQESLPLSFQKASQKEKEKKRRGQLNRAVQPGTVRHCRDKPDQKQLPPAVCDQCLLCSLNITRLWYYTCMSMGRTKDIICIAAMPPSISLYQSA